MSARRGAVYIAVLMSSLLVASLTLAALHSAQYYGRSLNDESDYGRCQLAADAGLEWAVARINADVNWRNSHVHNVDIPARVLNGVSIRYRLIDNDGDLKDDLSDECDIVLTASTGSSTCTWRAALIGAGPALECLSYAASTADDFLVRPLSVFSTDGNIASATKVEVSSGGAMTANSYTKLGSFGAIYGTKATLAGTLNIPKWQDLTYYTAYGTPINANLLPTLLGDLQLKGQLLSQYSNTISGTLSPSGIYVIDCGGKNIVISHCRLQCTLVLVNPGSNSAIKEAVYWEAAQPNYPALLSQGKIQLNLSNAPLYESVAGRNLNPPETPFRGQSDGNTSTVYPSQIRGIVYAAEDIWSSSATAHNHVIGCLVGRIKIDLTGRLMVHSRSIFAVDPPPGFGSFTKVRIGKGSIRRVAAP